MTQSLLGRAAQNEIVAEPFPHVVIRNALDAEYYQELAESFPPADIILNGREHENNRNFRYPAKEALSDPRIPLLWQRFIRHHVSKPFLAEVVEHFGRHISSLHAELEAIVGKPLSEWESSARSIDAPRDIVLECQFAYGTPDSKPSRLIGPHVDREVALFAGLFYMRDDADDSVGGDLELYRFADGRVAFPPDTRCVPDKLVVRCRTIRYEANTLVFFLHSPHSLHGVSPRSATRFPRRHVNLVGELPLKVFDLTRYDTLAAGPTSCSLAPRQ